MPQDKLDSEDAKVANSYIHRTVKEVERIMSALEPDIRLIVLARVQRDTAEEIQEIEISAARKRQNARLGG